MQATDDTDTTDRQRFGGTAFVEAGLWPAVGGRARATTQATRKSPGLCCRPSPTLPAARSAARRRLPPFVSVVSVAPFLKSVLSPLLRCLAVRPIISQSHPEVLRGAWVLRNERTGGVVASTIECAFDSASRRKGLLGRAALPDDAAIIIAPCNSIHTFFMQFSIDVAFVARDGHIVPCQSRGVCVEDPHGGMRAFAVVELSAGALDRADTKENDRLRLSLWAESLEVRHPQRD